MVFFPGLPKIGQMQLANLVDRTVLKSGVDLLHRLAAVWRTILPRIVFLQAIGKIIGEMLNDISYRLISVEDINATDSTILCGNFLWLLAEAENVLKVRKPTNTYCPTQNTLPRFFAG